MTSPHIVAGVELGSSKIVVLIGEVLPKKKLNIIGFAESPSAGIRKGEIIDFKDAIEVTHATIEAAEKSASASIGSVYLAQTGAHLQGLFHSGTVNVSSSDGVVKDSDIDRSIREAKNKELSAGRVYLHHVHNGFQLDGRSVVKPLGSEGQQLSVGYWSIHADMQRLRDTIHIINGFGLTVDDVIASSLASANTVASEIEKSSGVLVIDIGAGTTDYALYKNGFIARTGVIPVGGDHFTNDLSLGLRIPAQRAETLKREIGSALSQPQDELEKLWLIGDKSLGDRAISKRSLVAILEARARELFAIIHSNLKDFLQSDILPGGIILTGGSALLLQLETIAAEELHLSVRLAENPDWIREDLRLPHYSTVIGLLTYALSGSSEPSKVSRGRKDFFHRFAKLLHLAN